MTALDEWVGWRVLDTERACTLEKPGDAGAIEMSGPPEAIGLRDAGQQLEVDFLRESTKRAIARPASPI